MVIFAMMLIPLSIFAVIFADASPPLRRFFIIFFDVSLSPLRCCCFAAFHCLR